MNMSIDTTIVPVNAAEVMEQPGNGAGVPLPEATGHVKTLSELVSDIHIMENMVLYYQNRILRKRIAIAEILHGKECREIGGMKGPPAAKPVRQGSTRSEPSVRQMLEGILPAMNGSTFSYSDLCERLSKEYPEYTAKICRGVVPACHSLFRRGTLVRVSRGRAKRKTAL